MAEKLKKAWEEAEFLKQMNASLVANQADDDTRARTQTHTHTNTHTHSLLANQAGDDAHTHTHQLYTHITNQLCS